MSPTWRLLTTRPAEEGSAFEQGLSEGGVHAVNVPMLAIEPLRVSAGVAPATHPLANYAAVVVISKPAARLGLLWLAGRSFDCPWFCVGEASAEVLREGGVAAQWPADGNDSEALLRMPAFAQMLAGCTATGGRNRLLVMRGEGGREWLAEQVRRQGVEVDYLELYRRTPPALSTEALLGTVRGERLNGLVVSSGQGLRHLVAIAGEDWPILAHLPLFAPSQRVAEEAVALGASKTVNCGGASVMALLLALHKHPLECKTKGWPSRH